MKMVDENSVELNAILTPPFSLDGETSVEYKAPNLLQRVVSLFTNVRPGSDLTRFQLPPVFSLPKSQLQCFGESVYCVGDDMLSKCTDGKNPLEIFIAVVGWSISTTRPLIFGVAPFNPILGETHHASRGSLNVMLEQVSHHPPVTALHGTDETKKIETIWCHNTVPRFYGTSIEAVVHGKRQLKLISYDENYIMDSPNLLIRLFPVPSADWVGTVTIRCKETGLEAELSYKGHSFFGFRGSDRAIKGKISDSSTSKTLFEIDGHWDRTVTVKDVADRKTRIIYDAKKTISALKTPIVKDPQGLCSSESAVVWGEVNQSILKQEWDRASKAKRGVEDKQRELRKERECKGETWSPNHFRVSYTKEEGWTCCPKQSWVPPAPIIAPS
ncbi:hypothetical protein ACHQM5_030392 [Ranunculus cassubicifolius]